MRWIVLVIGLATACERTVTLTDPNSGRELYSVYCAGCHGAAGKPSEVMVIQLGVRDLTQGDVRRRLTPEQIRAQVEKGSANRRMPAFESLLSDRQIEAVAAWVMSPEFLAP